jgi:hypothetical protein
LVLLVKLLIHSYFLKCDIHDIVTINKSRQNFPLEKNMMPRQVKDVLSQLRNCVESWHKYYFKRDSTDDVSWSEGKASSMRI